MRPSEAQHRAALALHAGRTERFVRGELTPDEWRPIRLSYGLYYQLDHTSHMQRIKIPGGMLTAEQMEAMAEVADRYGRGIGHVTTRQDIQIHWVPIAGIIDLYERLLAAGITTRGACADSVRNVTACPYAGTAPREPFDVSPYCIALHEYFLFNPLNLTLPRKFKIAIEGCERDCAQAPVNDIGLYAKGRGGARRRRARPGAARPGARGGRDLPRAARTRRAPRAPPAAAAIRALEADEHPGAEAARLPRRAGGGAARRHHRGPDARRRASGARARQRYHPHDERSEPRPAMDPAGGAAGAPRGPGRGRARPPRR